MSTTTRTTTTTMDRIDMIQDSIAYKQKFRQPKHEKTGVPEDLYMQYGVFRKPKHRKSESEPRHRMWDIEQH